LCCAAGLECRCLLVFSVEDQLWQDRL